MRHDKGKVNRLRTYLAWKEVRKQAKDDGGAEVPELEDGDGAFRNVSRWSSCYANVAQDKVTAKPQKITIKLPWEISTVYSEVLKGGGHEDDDEEDEDDIEAHEASLQRLRVRQALSCAPSSDNLDRKRTKRLVL